MIFTLSQIAIHSIWNLHCFHLLPALANSGDCLRALSVLLDGILRPRHQGLNCPVPYGASFQVGHPIPRAVLVLAGWLLATVGWANVAHHCAWCQWCGCRAWLKEVHDVLCIAMPWRLWMLQPCHDTDWTQPDANLWAMANWTKITRTRGENPKSPTPQGLTRHLLSYSKLETRKDEKKLICFTEFKSSNSQFSIK